VSSAGILVALAVTSGCAGTGTVAPVADSAWSAAGQPQYEGVVRLVAPGNTADLTITVYHQRSGSSGIACGHYLSQARRAFIMDFGVYPQNQHSPFPSLTVSLTNRQGEPMYSVKTTDDAHTPCRPVVDLRMRSLGAGEEGTELGAFPAATGGSLTAVVRVDGTSVDVPLRPMCRHGESQSVTGCVYDPLQWNDQPGFPSITI